jgi:hypothetical protein
MAEGKKSILFYVDWHDTFKELNDEDAGKLIKHIFAYVNDENPICDDLIINIAFEPIKQSLKRDLKRYEEYIDKQSVNGAKGGRPKKATETQITQPFFEKPKKADSVSDSVNDNESDIINNLDFDSIWNLYLKVGNKKKSEELYNKQTKAKKELIKNHIPLYIKNHIDNDKKDFIPHFTTYLNGERWNDQLPYKQTKQPVQPRLERRANLND